MSVARDKTPGTKGAWSYWCSSARYGGEYENRNHHLGNVFRSPSIRRMNQELTQPLAITDLGELTEEEQAIFIELQQIENDPEVVRQAQEETQIPLEAFGEGDCSHNEPD